VKESKDFQLLFEGDRCSLVINEVYLEDSGEYKCEARNKHGAAHSTCRLIVDRKCARPLAF
jgi:titin